MFFFHCSDLFKFIVFDDALIDIRLSQLGSLINAISKATEVAVCAFASVLLIDQNVLVVHSVVIVFETHYTTFKWCVFVHCLLDFRVNKDLRDHWLGRLAWSCTCRIAIRRSLSALVVLARCLS